MRQETISNTRADSSARHTGTRTALASIGAIASVLAASSCCLPILPVLLAAGFAGSSTFLSAARPYLLGAAILFIGYGFYQAWRAKKCRRRPNVIASVLLWVAAVSVVISIFFPQVMANASANLLAR
ncbi:MAG TPA: hypothetical protein VLI55_11145 [Bryobacteraceae bacterium]|nr:hypothetical protein [Bryobacteraceae bacterium]